jgi:hypothetical protein
VAPVKAVKTTTTAIILAAIAYLILGVEHGHIMRLLGIPGLLLALVLILMPGDEGNRNYTPPPMPPQVPPQFRAWHA